MIRVDRLYFKELPRRDLARTPRDRYVTYHRDLHRIAGDVISEETLIQGDQYSYTELGDAVLDDARRDGALGDVDLAVYAYWTPEFDPDYSAFGPYFIERHGMRAQSFDVCDTGSLASVTALDVISRHLLDDPAIRSVLLLGMEQTTIPRNLDHGVPIPERSSAGAAILTVGAAPAGLQVLGCGHIGERECFGSFDPLGFLEGVLARFGLRPGDVTLLTQRCGGFHKRLRFQLDTAGRDDPVQLRFLSPAPSALNGLRAMASAMDTARAFRPVTILIDEDVESLRLGWVAFGRGP